MRQVFLAAMLIPAGLTLLSGLALFIQLSRFRRLVPTLRTLDDVHAFKRLASVQMYVTLATLGLQIIPPLAWLCGKFIVGVLGWMDLLLYVVLPFGAVMAIAALGAGTASAVRGTPAANPSLEAERDHVADVWVNRSFPDW